MSWCSRGIAGGLSSFPCPGSSRQRERGVSAGEVSDPGEFPVRYDQGGVFVEQLASLLGSLVLAVGAAFAADGAESGGVPAAFRSKVAATPRHR